MLLSRFRKNKESKSGGKAAEPDKSDKLGAQLNAFLNKRDYAGAVSLLSFEPSSGGMDEQQRAMWLAYCAMHVANYQFAYEQYKSLSNDRKNNTSEELHLYLACTQYFMGMYEEAKESAIKGPKSALQIRILLHVAHKVHDEPSLVSHHAALQDVLQDQLCLASVHYLRGHYQEAIDIYKRILLGNRSYIALNVYLALCYYKLDFYDVSLEVLAVYLQANADSVVAVNLKACNHYKLFSGKSAQAELKTLEHLDSGSVQYGKDLVEHNNVVFGGGERALAVLPRLIDVMPEARLNLIIYHLRTSGELDAAYALCADLQRDGADGGGDESAAAAAGHMQPTELILCAIVHCLLAQKMKSKEHMGTAQEYFRTVGSSSSECDTIAGRQCMASALFLAHQFDDVLTYLESIKNFFYNDDTFNYNYAQALAAVGRYAEAEAALTLIQQPQMTNQATHLCTLARCYIMNGKAKMAWNLYLQSEANSDSFMLLQLIANDCYRTGQFYYAARAFDVLERLDGGSAESWNGKRGACVGAFAQIAAAVAAAQPQHEQAQQQRAGAAGVEQLRDVLSMLAATSHPQVDAIVRTIRRWAKDNNLPL